MEPSHGSESKPERESKDSVRFKSTRNQQSATTKINPSNRIETDVLLAIQPVHLRNIVSGQKNHEYRKYRLRDGVERLWLYETLGTQQSKGRGAITHIATIPPNIRHTPGSVPEEPFGIGNAEVNAGDKESKYGYPILGLYELVNPITLNEMKQTWGMGAPMGWCYVKERIWQDRWGDVEGREARVTKLF